MPRATRTPGSTKPRTPAKGRGPRPGLPDKSSIVAVKTLTSPKGNRYRIIETDETDAYDPPVAPGKKPER
jgi:hypothetical protein